MSNSGVKRVPPDGGYGWVVACAYALNNVVVLPTIASFGLVFQEAFPETNLTGTQGTLVITLNHGIGMLLSLFGGPLLRRFSYRKVAVAGAVLISGGLLLTSFATSFWMFILSYSIINSMGIAAVMAAFTLAINSFFREKRSRAIGIAMSITGLGAITMPLLMSALMKPYGWRVTVQALGGMCAVSFLAACLLRPVKYYLVDPPSAELTPLQDKDGDGDAAVTNGLPPLTELKTIDDSINTTKSLSLRLLPNESSVEVRNAVSIPDLRREPEPARPLYKWWESQEINLASSLNIFDEDEAPAKQTTKKRGGNQQTPHEEQRGGFLQKVVRFFDLTLLTDPIFVNILFGLSVASCVETNFSLLLPLILKNLKQYDTGQIATLMAVIGVSDTLFRLCTPFIGEFLKKPPRVMYVMALVLMVAVRTVLLFVHSFTGMIFVSLAIGVTKGMRTVYMNVIIPNYVPIERLPFASGIQMFFNGIIIISIGSLLGRLRESSGSFHIPIIVLNVVTFVAVIAWSAEFLYFRVHKQPTVKVTAAA